MLFLVSILINIVTTGSDKTGTGRTGSTGSTNSSVVVPPYDLKPGETYPHRIPLVESEVLPFDRQVDLKADWHFTRYELRNVTRQGKEYGTEPLSLASFHGPTTVTTSDGGNFRPLFTADPELPADVISAYFSLDITQPVLNNDTFTVSMPFDHPYEVRVLPVYEVYQFEIWERPYFSDPKQLGRGELKLPFGHKLEGWDLGV
ncbi:hypothetical protein EV586_105119 [Tumebacillus sp. BK434]|nr:hypothetical protein EV586_105119 [Tumebacillus sp. BK434]